MFFNIMNIINILIIVILVIYIIVNKKPPIKILKIINHDIFKIIILFLMIIINNSTISILIFMAYIITIQYNIKESFSCLCGKKLEQELL